MLGSYEEKRLLPCQIACNEFATPVLMMIFIILILKVLYSRGLGEELGLLLRAVLT